jgi:hypothetical protein
VLAIYPFDEEAGDVARDASSNEQDAKLVNAPEHLDGKLGRALRFDGEKSYVQLPDLGLQSALTVSAWLNMTSHGSDNFANSIMHADGWNLGDLHFMVLGENGRIRVGVNGIGDLESKYAFSADHLGQWVHVTLVYDAKSRKLQLYVNGQLDSTGGVGVPRSLNLSSVKIGSWGGHARPWKGMMDDFRFYDQVLDAGQIARLFRGEPIEAITTN